MKGKDNIKVVIAENSVILRSGINSVLKRLPDYSFVINEIANSDAFAMFMKIHTPDLLIVNPLFSGGFNLQNTKKDYPNVRVIAFVCGYIDMRLFSDYDACISMFDDADEINSKLNALFHTTEDENSETELLSSREKEIISGVVKGLTNKAIADWLSISIHTVITHRRNISKKLQIHSSAGLAIYAIVNKIVEIQDIKNGINYTNQ